MWNRMKQRFMQLSKQRFFGVACNDVNSPLLQAAGSSRKMLALTVRPDFDFFTLFSRLDYHQYLLYQRNIPVDLRNLFNIWQGVQCINEKKKCLETERKLLLTQVAGMQGKLLHDNLVVVQKNITSINAEIKLLKKRLKQENDKLTAITLELPNLHTKEKLQLTKNQVLYRYKKQPTSDLDYISHLELGSKANQIFKSSGTSFSLYLVGDAAKFELDAVKVITDIFLNMKFHALGNPNFFKSAMIAGCEFDEDHTDVFMLNETTPYSCEKTLYLTGAASLPAFCAFFTRMIIQHHQSLPVRLYSVGRVYKPNVNNESLNLYSSNQELKVTFFIATSQDKKKLMNEYNFVLNNCLIKFFKSLGIHFRILNTGLANLAKQDSHNIRIQLWSPFEQQYVDIAAISNSNDFISRRFMSCYLNENNNMQYLNLIHGDISITRLLGVVMENTQVPNGKWIIPNVFKI